jgi:hypothetical protein
MACERFDVFGYSSNVDEIAFEQYWRVVVCLFAFSIQMAVASHTAKEPKMDKLIAVLAANFIHSQSIFYCRLELGREVLRSGQRLDLSGYRDLS